MPDCWLCGAHRSNTQKLFAHIDDAHGHERARVINEAPADVRYQWTTIPGQQQRVRGKPPPKVEITVACMVLAQPQRKHLTWPGTQQCCVL